MKRYSFILFAQIILLSAGLSAQQRPERSEQRNADLIPVESSVDEHRYLFFKLPELGPETDLTVGFRVSVGGKLSFSEVVMPQPNLSVRNPAVEFLAQQPERLDEVYRLAEDNPIEVEVLLNGRLLQRFDFQQFVEYNNKLKRAGMSPLQGTSLIEDHGEAPSPVASKPDGGRRPNFASQTQCEADCYSDYGECAEYFCGDPEAICEYCLDGLANCLEECEEECSGSTVTTWTQTVLVSYGPTGYWQCLEEDFFNPDWFDGYYYDEWQYTYKTTTYQRTTYCDGSSSTVVLSVSYSYYYCNKSTFLTCFYPWGLPFNTC